MISTTTSGADFLRGIAQDVVPWTFKIIDDGTKKAYRMLWDAFIPILLEHWISILIFLTAILSIAIIRALAGYWGMLGKVLYHYLYFGILFVIGFIRDPEIFVSVYFEIFCAIILYPICYLTVGAILDKFNLRRRF
jgi:ABC-type glycerol-3-phosphate transport system permease component